MLFKPFLVGIVLFVAGGVSSMHFVAPPIYRVVPVDDNGLGDSAPTTPVAGFRARGATGSAPATPERPGIVRAGTGSVPPSPERVITQVDFNALVANLAELTRRTAELRDQIRLVYGQSMRRPNKKPFLFGLVAAYLLTEVLCVIKKECVLKKNCNGAESQVLRSSYAWHFYQQLMRAFITGITKGLIVYQYHDKGFKSCLCAHFLLQSFEATAEAFHLHELFEGDMRCYLLRLFTPLLCVCLKKIIEYQPNTR